MAAAKVLLIDDDADFVRIHKAYLEEAGFAVVTAYDGEEGLATAREEKPNLVILDYMMMRPTEGSIVALEFKDDPELKGVPILLLTSVRAKHPWWGVDKSDKYLPVDAFLDKPVPADVLIGEVNRLLGSRS
ncbi:MAG: response regulator [Chloroflexota bacterium]